MERERLEEGRQVGDVGVAIEPQTASLSTYETAADIRFASPDVLAGLLDELADRLLDFGLARVSKVESKLAMVCARTDVTAGGAREPTHLLLGRVGRQAIILETG